MFTIFRIMILILLCLGLLLLFGQAEWSKLARRFMRQSREGMEEASKKRILESRRQLVNLQRNRSFWHRMEQQLYYSGIKQRFPFLTAESWIVCNVLVLSVVLIFLFSLSGWRSVLFGVIIFFGVEYLIFFILKALNYQRVNAGLMKFLDFLGNYSVTAGELTGVFTQISKYMDEPIRTALEECSYEAQTTGDFQLALLSMSEKIEHPKFKELVRNMEISIRYCADFSILVLNSRRMIREYMRLSEERRGLLRESAINMLLLLGMSIVTLFVVDGLLDASIWTILFHSLPGQIALAIVGFICTLFLGKLMERR